MWIYKTVQLTHSTEIKKQQRITLIIPIDELVQVFSYTFLHISTVPQDALKSSGKLI